jgi:hypothetical protein
MKVWPFRIIQVPLITHNAMSEIEERPGSRRQRQQRQAGQDPEHVTDQEEADSTIE